MLRLTLAVTLLARYAAGQATEAGLAQALQSAQLTTCAALFATDGAATLRNSLVQNGGTAFCPTNAAFTAANITATTPVTGDVVDVLSYHVARGQFPATSISEDENSIVRTYLDDGVNLPGGQSQVLVLGKLANGTVIVQQGLANATVTASATYQSIVVHAIDRVLTVPGSLGATATAAGLSSLALSLEGVLPGLVAALQTVPGITVFAPVNSAFDNLPGLLSSIPSATIQNVLANHVLNGTVVYSPSLESGSRVTTASGAQLSFIVNSTGIFAVADNSTAQILIADVPIANGVVHVISNALVTYTANSDAAQQAIASRSSEAATQTADQTDLISQLLPTSIAPVTTAQRSAADSKGRELPIWSTWPLIPVAFAYWM